MSAEIRTVWAGPLTQFCLQVFEKLGVPSRDAFTTSEVLVLADLRGIESHGVARLRRYYTGLKNGVMVPTPKVRVVHETPITARIDGGGALGQVAGNPGMTLAIEKARKTGVGLPLRRAIAVRRPSGILRLLPPALPHGQPQIIRLLGDPLLQDGPDLLVRFPRILHGDVVGVPDGAVQELVWRPGPP